MKKLTSLIIFFVVLGLAYTGYWFYQAHQVKELVATHLKEYEKADQNGYHLKTENLSVEGFPLNYEVKISNPRYELAEASDNDKASNITMEGAIKVGSDVLGKRYWIKQEGDLTYLFPNSETHEVKKFIAQGNMEIKADVVHPDYWKSLAHPFAGFPKVFYKPDATLQEIIQELNSVSYSDRDFVLYEVIGNEKKELLSFSDGQLNWKHSPQNNETEKFELSVDVKDLAAADNGQPLIPHIQKYVDVNSVSDMAYLLGSGKNNLAFDFEALLPMNLDFATILSHKDLGIRLKDFRLKNLYGDSSVKFDVTLSNKDELTKNIHLGFNAASEVTPEGSEAMHKHFIQTLKQKAASNENDPDQKVLVELLKCCQEKLESVIPDYTKLGKMQFVINKDVLINHQSGMISLNKIQIHNLDATAEPYGITSHGEVEMVNENPKGLYEINLNNYQALIHDLTNYYNRIHPILERFAEANKQVIPIDNITQTEEKEIIDFLKSLSKNPESNANDLAILIDFNGSELKIGNNSFEHVRLAWDKLIADLTKQVPPAKPEAEKPVAPEVIQEPAKV